MTIANTIFQQLGGRAFVMMTGASQPVDLGDGLQIKIGRNRTPANFLTIRLNASDLYDLEFTRATVRGIKVLHRETGVFDAMLCSVISNFTGLCLTPPRIFRTNGQRIA